MSDERTQEQRDADDNLHAALQRVHRAYSGDDGMVLTQWVACLGVHGQDEKSTVADVILQVSPEIPRYHLVGLLRDASLQVETEPPDAEG